MTEVADTLSIKEVAQELDVAYITALTYVHRSQIKGVRRGGQWIVTKEELVRFKAEGNHPDYDPSLWTAKEETNECT